MQAWQECHCDFSQAAEYESTRTLNQIERDFLRTSSGSYEARVVGGLQSEGRLKIMTADLFPTTLSGSYAHLNEIIKTSAFFLLFYSD